MIAIFFIGIGASSARYRVLRDPVLELTLALTADSPPQLVRGRDVDPAVVGQVDTGGPAELLLQLGDLMLLLRASQHRFVSYAAMAEAAVAGSIRTPGPMVVEIAIFLR